MELVHTTSYRVEGFLEREGIQKRDEENSYLNLEEGDENPMQQVLGNSVSYCITVGPQQGRNVLTLQTIPAWEDDDRFTEVAKVAGFSLHVGISARAWDQQKLELRLAVSEKRLSVTLSGNIRYQLKTPYSDGTTHVIFESLDFIARLTALAPKPRVNLTR